MARRGRTALLVAACALAAGSPRADAWGFTAHRLVHRQAVRTLPDGLREAFAGNVEYLAEHSIDADLERATGADPDHFLDIDAFGSWPFAAVGGTEAEHLGRHGADARRLGRVPWRIAELHAELVQAFRAKDTARALERAALLGHLVADAHVPLHATRNHDGQETGQAGIHGRWESGLVSRFAHQLEPEVLPAAGRALGDPAAEALAVVRESWLHVGGVLESDRQAAAGLADRADTPEDDRYEDEYYSRLFARERARVVARLAASAGAVGSYWRDAWEKAGRPALPPADVRPVRGSTRAILLSLDGGAAHVFDEAIARGVMPHLAALRARGATGRSVAPIPTKTAPGHAAMYTGAWSDRNGITGNEVPPPGGSLLEATTGYSAVALTAEPLWYAAARQGLDVTVASATHAFPFSTYFAERRFPGSAGRRLALFDGYQNLEAEDEVYTAEDLAPAPAGAWLGALPAHAGEPREVVLSVAGLPVPGLVYDDPADPAPGFDTLVLARDRDLGQAVTLKAQPPRGDADAFALVVLPMGGARAAVYFRLFELAPDLSRVVLYRTAPHVLRASRPRLEEAALAATGGFVGNGASWPYGRGELGPQVWKGGDGTAERRYLETVALVARQFARLGAFAAESTSWHLLFTYLPYPDEALHLWYGVLDAGLPGHDPAIAAKLRPHVDTMLRLVDVTVGETERRAEQAGAVLLVAADHGMTSAGRVVRPNVLLARAGLLAVDGDGRIDPARTRAMYFAGNNGQVVIHHTSYPGGIVPPADEAAVRRAVRAALLDARDPATGAPAVREVIDPAAIPEGSGMGGPRAGDLYVVVAQGYDLNTRATGEPFEAVSARGTHFQTPREPRLLAAFAMAGPGITAGADLGVIQQVDIAPTLAALLGIRPPRDAVGVDLRRATSRRSAPRPAAPSRPSR